MKYREIKDLRIEELTKRQAELKEEVFHLRMKNALGQLTNPLEVRSKRRDIARVKTVISEKLAR